MEDLAVIFQQDMQGSAPHVDEMVSVEIPAETPPAYTFQIGMDGAIAPVETQNQQFDLSSVPFEANLAKYIAEFAPDDLSKLGLSLSADFQQDLSDRKDWEEVIRRGIERLPLKYERKSEPFEGACGVRHPMVLEAAVTYQSNAITEIFPARGPVMANILGEVTEDKKDQAQRVADHMNYFLTRKMEGYRADTEALLLHQGLIGSGFRKVFPNEHGEPCAMYIAAEDFVINAGAASIYDATRYSQILKMSKAALQEKQVAGLYLPMPVTESLVSTESSVKEAKERAANSTPAVTNNQYCVLVECSTRLNIPLFDDPGDVPKPYVVTFTRDEGKVLSIYRNWEQSDPTTAWQHWVVPYIFIPGFDPYGIGLIHTQGQVEEAATALIRNLVNAGAYANFPSGVTSIRTNKLDRPVAPGTLRVLEGALGDISKDIHWFPPPQPSPVLLQLLQGLIAEGNRLGAIGNEDIKGLGGGETPFSTILALMERGMQIPTAVIARLHDSLTKEFRLIQKLLRNYVMRNAQGPEMRYLTAGKSGVIRVTDYDDTITISPVSDPNASTFAQRLLKMQSVVATIQQLPQFAQSAIDIQAVLRTYLESMGIREKELFVPKKDNIPPADPATDIANILMGRPFKVYEWQPHEAHFQAVQSALQGPQLQQTVQHMPNGQGIMAQLLSYGAQHFAYMWRQNVSRQLGAPLPPLDQPQPPEVTMNLAMPVAQAVARLTQKDVAEEQMKKNAAAQQDPVLQLQVREQNRKDQQTAADIQTDQAKIAADAQAKQEREKTERMRIEAQAANNAKQNQTEMMWLISELQKAGPQTDEIKARVEEIKARTEALMRGDGHHGG